MLEEGRTYEGGCLCGEVRYVVQGPSLFESQCCCRDCQRATGTGHTTIVGVHRSRFELSGEPKTFTNSGESGGTVTRHFCGNCGGRLYTSGTLPGAVIMIQAGSLDDPSAVTPQNVIYGKDAVSWDYLDPGLERFEVYAPFDQKTLNAMRETRLTLSRSLAAGLTRNANSLRTRRSSTVMFIFEHLQLTMPSTSLHRCRRSG